MGERWDRIVRRLTRRVRLQDARADANRWRILAREARRDSPEHRIALEVHRHYSDMALDIERGVR